MSKLSLDGYLTVTMIAAMGLVGACSHHGLATEYPETPAARADSVRLAVVDIVHARCDLEQQCANVGPGQKFDTRDACESKMQGTTASALNIQDCPLGVNNKKLETCLANIRAEECTSLFDSMSRWNACRNGQICYQEASALSLR